MPVSPTYPGVYIEEIPSGVRTIVGVATSITAFVGRAPRGPVDEAVEINSYGDFERMFGGLWAESWLGFAVRDFYLNGGSRAIIARVFAPTFANDVERNKALAAATNAAQLAADKVKAAAKAEKERVVGPAPTADSVASEATKAVASADAGAAKWAAEAVAKAAEEKAADKASATPQNVLAAAEAAVAAAVMGAADRAAPNTKAKLTVDSLSLEARHEGAWGNDLRARIDYDLSDDAATMLGLNKADLFNLVIRDMNSKVTEQFRNLTWRDDGGQAVRRVLESESRLVRVGSTAPTARPAKSDDPAAGEDPFGETTSYGVTEKASDGLRLTKDAFTGGGKEAAKTGLFALEKADLFNLLCIPPYNDATNVDKELIGEALAYCEARRAFLIIDPPSGWNSKEKAKAGIETEVGRVSKNAAIFFPRLTKPNPLRNNQLEDFVPCGAVAGIFARTDAQRGVWKAPAGLDAALTDVDKLSVPLTDNENGELNPKGINCLRAMPAVGRVVWGARTRHGDDRLASEWKYIPIRRLALFIEESLYRGTQWVVFEPNDEPLWSQIRLNVGAFMHGLFRQGAFQGKTSKEAYLVKCDAETTIQDDRNRGIVNITVGFAPLKPAEFVIIKIQQLAGQIET